jgi:hypothetical protein
MDDLREAANQATSIASFAAGDSDSQRERHHKEPADRQLRRDTRRATFDTCFWDIARCRTWLDGVPESKLGKHFQVGYGQIICPIPVQNAEPI